MISPDAPSLASNDSETTPLYARFGLSQRSTNSSVAWMSGSSNDSDNSEEDDDEAPSSDDNSNNINNSNSNNNNAAPNPFFRSPALSPGPQTQVNAQLGQLLGENNPWQVLNRLAKRQRTMMTPTQKVPANDSIGTTKEATQLWTLVDDITMQKHHIDLLNADIAHMGHKRVGLLCSTKKYNNIIDAKQQFMDEEIKGIGGGGYWTLYFPVTDLNKVWSGLVSQCIFWDDSYASTYFIELVSQEKNVAEYTALNIARRTMPGMASANLSTLPPLGFDTICKLVDRGDMEEDVKCCRLRVNMPGMVEASVDELIRTGKRLLLTLPETSRGPILYCNNDKNTIDGSSASYVPTERQHGTKCTYRMCAEKVSIRADPNHLVMGRPKELSEGSSTVVMNTDVPQYIRDDEKDVDGLTKNEYKLYSASGLVWNPLKTVQ